MLAGRYPSDAFAELRPRLIWDRITGELTGRAGAQRLAVTSGGTIPDRGLFGVFLASADGPGRRVGELDEEMVYESRVGEVFLLGFVVLADRGHHPRPGAGHPGARARPARCRSGRAIRSAGRPSWAARSAPSSASSAAPTPRRPLQRATRGRPGRVGRRQPGRLPGASRRAATGQLPTDRTIVVERFRDELGDWRLVIHSPFGAPVNAPWALAISAALRERYGMDVQSMHSDDGIVLRLPDTTAEPPGADIAVFDPAEIESIW